MFNWALVIKHYDNVSNNYEIINKLVQIARLELLLVFQNVKGNRGKSRIKQTSYLDINEQMFELIRQISS